MLLRIYDYIKLPDLTGDIVRDAERLLCENGKRETFEHVCAVAEQNRKIAAKYGLDEEKCFISGILHDISVVIRPEDMLEYAKQSYWLLCEAEMRYPFLLHQKISTVAAKEHFGISDTDILSAISCHTTLRRCADNYQMALFVADKLAWDRDGKPPFFEAVSAALEISPEKACYEYMKYMTDSGEVLYPHTNWTEAFEYLKVTSKNLV